MDVDQDDDVLISTNAASTPNITGPSDAPVAAATTSSGFAPLNAAAQSTVLKNEFRRIPIPPHRMTPLKRDWVNLYTPMVEMLGLQVRMNPQRKAVELKVSTQLFISGQNLLLIAEKDFRAHCGFWCDPKRGRLCQSLCPWI